MGLCMSVQYIVTRKIKIENIKTSRKYFEKIFSGTKFENCCKKRNLFIFSKLFD